VAVADRRVEADPIFVGEGDIDAARALVEEAEEAELFLYPGDQHYFADSSLPSYRAQASTLLIQRVLDFLALHHNEAKPRRRNTGAVEAGRG